jgi:hypothetical protein
MNDMRRSLVYTPTCAWNTADGKCGRADGREYIGGFFCPEHSPWGRAGTPEPLTPTEVQQRQEQQQ